MFWCQTENCSQKGVKHTAHPEGVSLYCGCCGNVMAEVTK